MLNHPKATIAGLALVFILVAGNSHGGQDRTFVPSTNGDALALLLASRRRFPGVSVPAGQKQSTRLECPNTHPNLPSWDVAHHEHTQIDLVAAEPGAVTAGGNQQVRHRWRVRGEPGVLQRAGHAHADAQDTGPCPHRCAAAEEAHPTSAGHERSIDVRAGREPLHEQQPHPCRIVRSRRSKVSSCGDGIRTACSSIARGIITSSGTTPTRRRRKWSHLHRLSVRRIAAVVRYLVHQLEHLYDGHH